MDSDKSSSIDNIIGINNQVTDNSIVTGLWISSSIGGAVLVLFCILQRSSSLYRYRLAAQHVRVPPRHLASTGLASLFDWAFKAMTISDLEFLLSAGLDALLMVKLCALGVQLFLPLCFVGVVLLIPLHWTGGESEVTSAYHSNFMRLTMSNIERGSSRFWVHLACVYLYLGWAMWLLGWHYHEFLQMRQTYMQKGDNENSWRKLYTSSPGPDTAPAGTEDGNIMHQFMENVRIIKDVLMPTTIAASADTPQDVLATGDDEDEEEAEQARLEVDVRHTPVRKARRASLLMGPSAATTPDTDPLRRLPPPAYLTRRGSQRMSVHTDRLFAEGEGQLSPRTRFGDVVARTSAQDLKARRDLASTSGVANPRSSPAADGGPSVSSIGRTSRSTPPRGETGGLAEQAPAESQPPVGHSHSREHGHGLRLSPVHHLPPLTEEPAAALEGGPATRHRNSAPVGRAPAPSPRGGRPVAEATEGTPDCPARGAASTSSRRPSLSVSEVRVSLSGEEPDGGTAPYIGGGDIEMGLADARGRRSSRSSAGTGGGGNAGAGSPPVSGPMARSNSLDDDARDMEWWRGDELRPITPRRASAGGGGGAQTPRSPATPTTAAGAAADASAAGAGAPASADVRKFRPSVSLRKTVNAINMKDGNVVAVFAQHYAVLVTDVVEHPKGDAAAHSRVNSASTGVKLTADVSGTAATRPRTNILPSWLRSWWQLGYGTTAARELNGSRGRSSESLDGTAFGSTRRSLTITVHGSRQSHGSDQAPNDPLHGTASPVLHSASTPAHHLSPGGVAAAPGHRRSLSAGFAVTAAGAPAGSGGQGAARQLSRQEAQPPASSNSGRLHDAATAASGIGLARAGSSGADCAAANGATDAQAMPGAQGGGPATALPPIAHQLSAPVETRTMRAQTTPRPLTQGIGAPTARFRVGSAGGVPDRRPQKVGLLRVLDEMADHARIVAAGRGHGQLQHQGSSTARASSLPLPNGRAGPDSAAVPAAPVRQGARAPSKQPTSVAPAPAPEQGQGQQPRKSNSGRIAPAPMARDPAALAQDGKGDPPPAKQAATATGRDGDRTAAATGAARSEDSSGVGDGRLPAGPLGEATEHDDAQAGAADGGSAPGAARPPADHANGVAAEAPADAEPRTAAGGVDHPLSAFANPADGDGQRTSSGSSLRRRRGTGAAGAGENADSDGRSSGAPGSAGSGIDAAAIARARWAWLSDQVLTGAVFKLRTNKKYSVVSAAFAKMFPDEFDRAVPVINHKEVDLLLMQADQHMAQYEYAKKYEEKTGQLLLGRTGWCGLLGDRVRLREFHRERVEELMKKVRDARRRAFEDGHTPSWFVFFRTQRAASVAAQCLIHAEDNRQFKVHPAPGPDEVNWSALWSDYRARDWRRNLLRPLVVLVVAFPIGIFTGGLMQLDYLLCPDHKCLALEEGSAEWVASNCTTSDVNRESHQLSWEWYCEQETPMARLLQRLVVGWLPSLLINLWQGMVLPLVFMFVVQASRQARSLSDADRAVASYMFLFAVFNVFLGGVVGSTIIQGINSAITNGPSEIFNLVGTYLPTSSNFFINYTMFRALVAVPLRMLWPHIGIRMYLLRRYLRCSCIITKREKAFLMAPVSPRYGFEVGMVLLIFVIAFAFSVVSPILLPMAVLFFGLAWLFWRWALLYVYVRKYEGGGTMWPFIFNRVLICMCIFPFFTACVFITKHAYIQAILLFVTVPVILVRFQAHCYYRYQVGYNAMPLTVAARAPCASVDPWVYFPPPLLSNLAGWNPEWAKCWQGWNLPVMYV